MRSLLDQLRQGPVNGWCIVTSATNACQFSVPLYISVSRLLRSDVSLPPTHLLQTPAPLSGFSVLVSEPCLEILSPRTTSLVERLVLVASSAFSVSFSLVETDARSCPSSFSLSPTLTSWELSVLMSISRGVSLYLAVCSSTTCLSVPSSDSDFFSFVHSQASSSKTRQLELFLGLLPDLSCSLSGLDMLPSSCRR